MNLLDDKIADWEKRKSEIKNYYFPELPSKKRIKKIIEKYIYPTIKDKGFKFQKTNLSLVKNTDENILTIHFEPHSNNYKETVSFRLNIKLVSKKYASWAEKKYESDYKKNGFLLDDYHHTLGFWKRKINEDWYRLSIDDNKFITDEITSNLLNLSDIELDKYNALEKVIDEKICFLKELKYLNIFDCNFVLDLAEITNQTKKIKIIIGDLYEYWMNQKEYSDKKQKEIYIELKNRISQK
ncbi:hypothetical protein [Algibacter sp. 2305UL17-15]|uniref:hypothetical protein n=1 Tax=Algibacter sp. 2305UL17-15 TaxID=3231268 RepID=UPI0034595020